MESSPITTVYTPDFLRWYFSDKKWTACCYAVSLIPKKKKNGFKKPTPMQNTVKQKDFCRCFLLLESSRRQASVFPILKKQAQLFPRQPESNSSAYCSQKSSPKQWRIQLFIFNLNPSLYSGSIYLNINCTVALNMLYLCFECCCWGYKTVEIPRSRR